MTVFSLAAAAQRHTPTLCTSPHACAMTAQQKAVDACCSGNITALEALLHAGVGINHASGETQATLVHMAAYYGQVREGGREEGRGRKEGGGGKGGRGGRDEEREGGREEEREGERRGWMGEGGGEGGREG